MTYVLCHILWRIVKADERPHNTQVRARGRGRDLPLVDLAALEGRLDRLGKPRAARRRRRDVVRVTRCAVPDRTRRVRLVREERRGVSTQYGREGGRGGAVPRELAVDRGPALRRRKQACPISTG